MAKLADRMRKARESVVEVDGHRFHYLRPTIQQMVDLKVQGYSHLDLAEKFVVGWDNVSEVDLLKGGSTEPVVFDREAWREWLADNPEWWVEIGTAVVEAFNRFSDARDAAVKN